MNQKRSKKIKNTAIYYSVRAAMRLVGQTPGFAVPYTARWLGGIAYLVARRERQIAISQLSAHTALRGHPRLAKQVTRGVFNHLSESVIELCRLIVHPNNRPQVFIPQRSRCALNEALSLNKGVIFITGHIGNWELMAIHLADLGFPIHTMARASYDNRFTRLIQRERERFGVHAIYRGQPGVTAKMVRALKQGQILGVLIDQDTSVNSVFVPFFNEDANTPSGAAAFAIRTQTPVVLGTIKRKRTGAHRIDIEQVQLPDDVTEATALLTRKLEERIRKQMSQWVWFHQRWKTKQP
ncbi:MAG: lysophospholipid acyltransferase family protein [Deltaproteobacteria bacterium]|nr:lysophospholipid acyltransferase family protein [Deltaproteobacteria bacterium]MBN2671148.1 lysophospholipid acyltransferase family protein [Deltaproteobacteria bacterium]